MSKVPITARGAEALRDELNKLKTVERPRVIRDIADARAHGDLKENAEYHAAREQQSFIEGRIGEIEGKLANAQVIDPADLDAAGTVVFGATVVVTDDDSGKETTYQIVGEDEADIKLGLLSFNSPIARSLIGRHEGDEVTVRTPGGDKHLEIIDVSYI